jgi:hypothetical protein
MLICNFFNKKINENKVFFYKKYCCGPVPRVPQVIGYSQKNMYTTGSVQRQMAREPCTPYQI